MAEKLQQEFGARIDWRPFLLHPNTPPEGQELSKEKLESIVPMRKYITQITQANDMPIKFPGRIISSRRALAATEYAREQGKEALFIRATFDKVFAEAQDINDWKVMRDAAEYAELDYFSLRREMDTGLYDLILEAQRQEALNKGITNVPTFILNNRYAVVGVYPIEVFRTVLEHMGIKT